MQVKLKKAVVVVSRSPGLMQVFPCTHTAQITDIPHAMLRTCIVQPANIKEVVDRVSGTPFEELPAVLRDFKWTYDKVGTS